MHFSGATRLRVIIILILMVIVWQVLRNWNYFSSNKEELIRRAAGTPVLVTVYYEALCPDSKHFVVKQLQSTFERAPELIDVKLIPYGKATTIIQKDGSLKFECQHGQTECEANKIHACTIEIIEDFKNRLDLVSCMIRDNSNPKEALKRCTLEYSIDSEKIEKCSTSLHGSELLKMHGELTDALRPKMSFVPTVTLDGSQGRQASILKDLLTEICKIESGREPVPDVCKK